MPITCVNSVFVGKRQKQPVFPLFLGILREIQARIKE
jgi:hypothetical protein